MKRRHIKILGVLLGFSACAVGSPKAGVTTYTSSADFNAAIAGYTVSTEDYSSFTNDDVINAGDTFNGLTYSAFTPGPVNELLGGVVTDDHNSLSGLSLGGRQSGGATYFFGQDSVTITFAAPVHAVGVFFNVNADSGDYTLSTSAGLASTGSATFDTDTFVFAGLLSTGSTFTSVTFASTSASQGSFNLPEIIWARGGPAVPEPSALALGAIGLALSAVAGAARRRRANG